MAQVATVQDLLVSLDYGKKTAEHEILDALRIEFGLPPKANLSKALKHQTPGRVLTAILGYLKPFAYMIIDIYAFLVDAAIRTDGNLVVHVPVDAAEKLQLDLSQFRAFEQDKVGAVLRSEFDPSLLPKDGKWRAFHDGYWPPTCALVPAGARSPPRCVRCPEGTLVEAFRQFTTYFKQLHQIATDQLAKPDQDRLPAPGMAWDAIDRLWRDCEKRQRSSDGCAMEKDWNWKFFESASREFDSAARSVTVIDLQEFLALPYWKQRWQFYEVWFLTVVLRSYGLRNLELRTAGQTWTLAVGGVDQKPIAVGHIAHGESVEFYYQYQGIPPSPLFPGFQDRPEILVHHRSGSQLGTKVLLAAEVKARNGFGIQDMKGALFSLVEWEPEAIVGANYYSMNSGKVLNILTQAGREIVVADECQPHSASERELAAWLARFWRQKLGGFVAVVLIDTSGSMPRDLLPKAINYLRGELRKAPTTDLLIATFSDAVRFFPTEALDDGSLNVAPSGGTDLAVALKGCQERLLKDFPAAAELSVHVLTDLEVKAHEVEQLIQWTAQRNTSVSIHTWQSEPVEKLMRDYPSLGDLIEFLPR